MTSSGSCVIHTFFHIELLTVFLHLTLCHGGCITVYKISYTSLSLRGIGDYPHIFPIYETVKLHRDTP